MIINIRSLNGYVLLRNSCKELKKIFTKKKFHSKNKPFQIKPLELPIWETLLFSRTLLCRVQPVHFLFLRWEDEGKTRHCSPRAINLVM